MALEDVTVPRAGEWRWEGVQGSPTAYELTNPRGVVVGTWWGERNAPVGMIEMLGDLARKLNRMERRLVEPASVGTCHEEHLCVACYGLLPSCYCVEEAR